MLDLFASLQFTQFETEGHLRRKIEVTLRLLEEGRVGALQLPARTTRGHLWHTVNKGLTSLPQQLNFPKLFVL